MTRKDVAHQLVCNQLPRPLYSWIGYLVVGRSDPTWFSDVLKADLVARGVCALEDIT